MKEAIIYLGCSYPQLPNIKALRDFGIEVIGTDRENINSKTKSLLTEFHIISATDFNSLIKSMILLSRCFFAPMVLSCV